MTFSALGRYRLLITHPKPEVGQVDTSLRYTDILFGFVIRELFSRLQNWMQLDSVVRWHLTIGTILILGSWIGYRRSQNRSAYEVKFFNLPFFRFALDQLMLILYYRVATLTPTEGRHPAGDVLPETDTFLVVTVFILYLLWDGLGLCMAYSKRLPAEIRDGVVWRYPKIEEKKMTAEPHARDWTGFFITSGFLIAFVITYLAAGIARHDFLLPALASLLLLYRWVKEIRTSWKSQSIS